MVSSWTRLRDAVDPLTRELLGLYAAYDLDPDELARTAPWRTKDEARSFLRERGYEPQHLSAAKRHPDDGRLHDLSYRRVPSVHPPEVDATALQDWPPDACQYHAHVFVYDSGADVFSHYELRPDFFAPSFSIQRLRTHYRPRYGQDYLLGVSDLPV